MIIEINNLILSHYLLIDHQINFVGEQLVTNYITMTAVTAKTLKNIK